MLAVADDVVARVQQIGELVFLEGLEPVEQLLDLASEASACGMFSISSSDFGIRSWSTRQYRVS
jgi:hypothetical protein